MDIDDDSMEVTVLNQNNTNDGNDNEKVKSTQTTTMTDSTQATGKKQQRTARMDSGQEPVQKGLI